MKNRNFFPNDETYRILIDNFTQNKNNINIPKNLPNELFVKLNDLKNSEKLYSKESINIAMKSNNKYESLANLFQLNQMISDEQYQLFQYLADNIQTLIETLSSIYPFLIRCIAKYFYLLNSTIDKILEKYDKSEHKEEQSNEHSNNASFNSSQENDLNFPNILDPKYTRTILRISMLCATKNPDFQLFQEPFLLTFPSCQNCFENEQIREIDKNIFIEFFFVTPNISYFQVILSYILLLMQNFNSILSEEVKCIFRFFEKVNNRYFDPFLFNIPQTDLFLLIEGFVNLLAKLEFPSDLTIQEILIEKQKVIHQMFTSIRLIIDNATDCKEHLLKQNYANGVISFIIWSFCFTDFLDICSDNASEDIVHGFEKIKKFDFQEQFSPLQHIDCNFPLEISEIPQNVLETIDLLAKFFDDETIFNHFIFIINEVVNDLRSNHDIIDHLTVIPFQKLNKSNDFVLLSIIFLSSNLIYRLEVFDSHNIFDYVFFLFNDIIFEKQSDKSQTTSCKYIKNIRQLVLQTFIKLSLSSKENCMEILNIISTFFLNTKTSICNELVLFLVIIYYKLHLLQLNINFNITNQTLSLDDILKYNKNEKEYKKSNFRECFETTNFLYPFVSYANYLHGNSLPMKNFYFFLMILVSDKIICLQFLQYESFCKFLYQKLSDSEFVNFLLESLFPTILTSISLNIKQNLNTLYQSFITNSLTNLIEFCLNPCLLKKEQFSNKIIDKFSNFFLHNYHKISISNLKSNIDAGMSNLQNNDDFISIIYLIKSLSGYYSEINGLFLNDYESYKKIDVDEEVVRTLEFIAYNCFINNYSEVELIANANSFWVAHCILLKYSSSKTEHKIFFDYLKLNIHSSFFNQIAVRKSGFFQKFITYIASCNFNDPNENEAINLYYDIIKPIMIWSFPSLRKIIKNTQFFLNTLYASINKESFEFSRSFIYLKTDVNKSKEKNGIAIKSLANYDGVLDFFFKFRIENYQNEFILFCDEKEKIIIKIIENGKIGILNKNSLITVSNDFVVPAKSWNKINISISNFNIFLKLNEENLFPEVKLMEPIIVKEFYIGSSFDGVIGSIQISKPNQLIIADVGNFSSNSRHIRDLLNMEKINPNTTLLYTPITKNGNYPQNILNPNITISIINKKSKIIIFANRNNCFNQIFSKNYVILSTLYDMNHENNNNINMFLKGILSIFIAIITEDFTGKFYDSLLPQCALLKNETTIKNENKLFPDIQTFMSLTYCLKKSICYFDKSLLILITNLFNFLNDIERKQLFFLNFFLDLQNWKNNSEFLYKDVITNIIPFIITYDYDFSISILPFCILQIIEGITKEISSLFASFLYELLFSFSILNLKNCKSDKNKAENNYQNNLINILFSLNNSNIIYNICLRLFGIIPSLNSSEVLSNLEYAEQKAIFSLLLKEMQKSSLLTDSYHHFDLNLFYLLFHKTITTSCPQIMLMSTVIVSESIYNKENENIIIDAFETIINIFKSCDENSSLIDYHVLILWGLLLSLKSDKIIKIIIDDSINTNGNNIFIENFVILFYIFTQTTNHYDTNDRIKIFQNIFSLLEKNPKVFINTLFSLSLIKIKDNSTLNDNEWNIINILDLFYHTSDLLLYNEFQFDNIISIINSPSIEKVLNEVQQKQISHTISIELAIIYSQFFKIKNFDYPELNKVIDTDKSLFSFIANYFHLDFPESILPSEDQTAHSQHSEKFKEINNILQNTIERHITTIKNAVIAIINFANMKMHYDNYHSNIIDEWEKKKLIMNYRIENSISKFINEKSDLSSHNFMVFNSNFTPILNIQENPFKFVSFSYEVENNTPFTQSIFFEFQGTKNSCKLWFYENDKFYINGFEFYNSDIKFITRDKEHPKRLEFFMKNGFQFIVDFCSENELNEKFIAQFKVLSYDYIKNRCMQLSILEVIILLNFLNGNSFNIIDKCPILANNEKIFINEKNTSYDSIYYLPFYSLYNENNKYNLIDDQTTYTSKKELIRQFISKTLNFEEEPIVDKQQDQSLTSNLRCISMFNGPINYMIFYDENVFIVYGKNTFIGAKIILPPVVQQPTIQIFNKNSISAPDGYAVCKPKRRISNNQNSNGIFIYEQDYFLALITKELSKIDIYKIHQTQNILIKTLYFPDRPHKILGYKNYFLITMENSLKIYVIHIDNDDITYMFYLFVPSNEANHKPGLENKVTQIHINHNYIISFDRFCNVNITLLNNLQTISIFQLSKMPCGVQVSKRNNLFILYKTGNIEILNFKGEKLQCSSSFEQLYQHLKISNYTITNIILKTNKNFGTQLILILNNSRIEIYKIDPFDNVIFDKTLLSLDIGEKFSNFIYNRKGKFMSYIFNENSLYGIFFD